MESTIRLVTSVGTGNYTPIPYRWEDTMVTSSYPSVALVQLLGLAPGRATALLTEEAAQKHWEPLRRTLAEVGWTVECRLVPKGATEEEQMSIVDEVMSAVQPGEEIVLDVTQGLRHLPMVYLAALTYLVGLQGNRLRGIYYGAFDLKDDDPDGAAPIFDLTPLFRILQWYQAVGAAGETGDLRPVTRILNRDRAKLFKTQRGTGEFGQAADAVTHLAKALATGMPVEVGIEVRQAAAALDRLRTEHVPWPPARRALEWLATELDKGRWGKPVQATSGAGRRPLKSEVPLTWRELERQLDLAQWYVERYDFLRAVLLLREWLVSATVWTYGNPDRWLNDRERRRAEARLHALERHLELGLVTKDQAVLGRLWQSARNARNTLAHVGMGMDEVQWGEPEKMARAILDECRDALQRIARPLTWPVAKKGRLVITPLGLNPGPLFTICRRLRPDRLVIVTSRQANQKIKEALVAAGRSDVERRVLLIEDPFAADAPLEALVDRELRLWLASAEEVVVSTTGGTSFLGYVVQQVAREAERLGQIVRWCVLADRRPETEQHANPYVEGEVVWLGPQAGAPETAPAGEDAGT